MFKKGDRVVALTDYPENKYKRVSKWDKGIVIDPNFDGLVLVEFPTGQEEVFDHRLQLLSSRKETISKWLKETAWYIRIESPAHSKLIQEWLFEHGMKWEFSSPVNPSYTDSSILTNLQYGAAVRKFIMHGNETSWVMSHAQELIPQFKLTLESVQIPEAPKKTEQQLKLDELEATIQKAQQEIQQLKEMN